uniref:AB hydrolase-1 domain-containing protein n=1 Tax=Panagrellus redivivus TaxID=6233 RepID=A0A7E4V2K7_PANRE
MLRTSTFIRTAKRFASLSVVGADLKQLPETLYHLPVTLQTRNGDTLKFNAVYQDTKPEGSQIGTVVAIHGAPGSHKDYKYVEPLLSKLGIRVIGINFPGFGWTAYDPRLRNDNFERQQFVQGLIEGLNLKNIVWMGHSRGSENALLAASVNPDRTQGLALVNPTGLRIHRGMKPNYLVQGCAYLWTIEWLRPIFTHAFFRLLYKYFVKLRVRDGHEAGVSITTMTHCAIGKQRPWINTINAQGTPVLIVYGGNDWLVENDIMEELTAAFTDIKTLEVSTKGEDPDSLALLETHASEPRLSVCFLKESHYLQKHRAQFLANAVRNLMKHKHLSSKL